MDQHTQARLLALNRDFYNAIAAPFDQTRQVWPPGKRRLLELLPHGTATAPLSLLDVGCGNGRLGVMLASRGAPVHYVGVDADAQLLALAQKQLAALPLMESLFVQADLAQPDWPQGVPVPAGGFDAVVSLATLQHLPGYPLRRRVVQQLAALAAPTGLLALSGWQFLTSSRFTDKLIPWESIGIAAAETEPGDALLPWHQELYAVRYVHQIDLAEMTQLAADAGCVVESHYYADGKEGNLNLYMLLRKG
jgi:tRNA (uracil-5-)-methyltransferase TRM9